MSNRPALANRFHLLYAVHMKKHTCLLLTLLLLPLCGCFNEEIALTAYLETDGSVTLHALVENVFSMEKDPAKRLKAEREMGERILEEREIMLKDLMNEQGARRTRVIALRKTVPYAYLVVAEFDSLSAFLDMLGGDEFRFTVEMKLEGPERWLKISPESFKNEAPDESVVEDDDMPVRLIIVDTVDITSDHLRHSGDNGVILDANSLKKPFEIKWKPRKAPAETGSD